VRFRVLGPLEVRRDEAVVALTGERLRRLLAALLVASDRVVPIDRLAHALWDGAPPADPRNAIQTCVARLRERLGDGLALRTRSPGYVLELGPDQLDARRFEELFREARARRDEPAAVREQLDEALGLWRGPAYAGFTETIVGGAARRLDEQRLLALEQRGRARLLLGDVDELTSELDALLVEHPLREGFVGLQMRALASLDREREALAVCRAHRDRLVADTGLDPSPALRDLEGCILRGELARPARHTATGTDARASSPGTAPRASVPRPVTSLVGRGEEVDAILTTLADARVVTLTGTGGVGKTRLAAEVALRSLRTVPSPAAHRRSPRDEAVWDEEVWDEAVWVELAPIGDAAAVDHVLMTALGVDPGHATSPREARLEALARRRLLLVLDNAEHLLDTVGPFVDDVHRRCPDVRVLTTSRERLAIDGEQVVPVEPLPTDVPGTDVPSHAVQLFLDRAASTTGGHVYGDDASLPEPPQLDLITRICRQLDGLPLAIELAAARAGVLPLDALLETLEGDDPLAPGRRRGHRTRHRDLWAVADWSYQMLDIEQQRLFARSSVFAGPFGVDDAHAVCAPERDPRTATIGRLAALAERSLLVRTSDGTDRYRMLRPLRAFARQRLADQDASSEIAERHLHHVLDRVEHALSSAGEADHRWLVHGIDAVRAAHRRARRTGDHDALIRLVAALYWFDQWRAGGELLGWAEELCELDELADHPDAPKVHAAAAAAAWVRGELDLAGRRAAHAVTLGDGPDDPARALAFAALGDVALFEGRLEDAEAAWGEQTRLGRIGGDVTNEVLGLASAAMALAYRGHSAAAIAQADHAAARAGPSAWAFVRYVRGECRAEVDPDRAITLLDDAVSLARATHAGFVEDVARLTATCLQGRNGKPRDALPAFAELVEHWRRRGNWLQQWTTLRNLAELLIRLEADEPAVAIVAAVDVHASASPAFGAESQRLQRAMATARARLGEDRFTAARTRGAQLQRHETVDVALTTLASLTD
jgi:predicted ATPase/DNA-binding SARP family transcriptional activator